MDVKIPEERVGVLVGPGDRGIHADAPIEFPGGVGVGQQRRQNPVPSAVPGVPAVPLPHRLPGPEPLTRQIPPRDPRAVPVDDPFDHAAVLLERVTPPASVRGQ